MQTPDAETQALSFGGVVPCAIVGAGDWLHVCWRWPSRLVTTAEEDRLTHLARTLRFTLAE